MYIRKDYYFKKAKKEGFSARSAYKLLDINKKYVIINKGDAVLDIGCAPGSWIQAAKKCGAVRIVGVDIADIGEKIKRTKGLEFVRTDIRQFNALEQFDTILCDAFPKTSGLKEIDLAKADELLQTASGFALSHLKKEGSFLAKYFQGQNIKQIIEQLKNKFRFVKTIKPAPSRKESREMYLVAKGFLRC